MKDKPNKVTTVLKVVVTGEFYDDDATEETLRYAVEQDLEDAGFDVDVAMLKDQYKEIKALRLLVEWAEECGFGFDQFQEEYERYKDEIKDMKYIDGMIHVAKRTLEDHGAFEEE